MIVRFVAATIVGGIVLFILGYLVWGLALDGYMREHSTTIVGLFKRPPNFILLGAANLVLAALIALIAESWAKVRGFPGGLKIGLLVGFLVGSWTNLINEAGMEIYIGVTPMIIDTLAVAAVCAITGGAIGLVLDKMDKTAETA